MTISSSQAVGSFSTTAILLLGASDMIATAGTIAPNGQSGIKLDEVRFYTGGTLRFSSIRPLG